MCRALAYLGTPVLLDHLLYQPDSSLIKQAYAPKMLAQLSLAGFGIAAWDRGSHDPAVPFEYATAELPIFDANLRALSAKIRASAVLAHVRGVPYEDQVQVHRGNLHPFRYPGFPLALAHNGELASFDLMKYDLVDQVRPEILRRIRGTSDSEWVYALAMSQLEDPTRRAAPLEIVRALERALRAIRRVREKHGVRRSSSMNLFLCDGASLVAIRFAFDFGCYGEPPGPGSVEYASQWYTTGREYGFHDGEWKMVGGAASADSVIVASEPLTVDVSSWIEVPEYSAVYVVQEGGRQRARTVELAV